MNIVTPKILDIDACTLCQLKCADCDVQERLKKQQEVTPLGYLTSANFQRLLQLDRNFDEIRLINIGELFLNPDLLEIIRIAHEKNIPISVPAGVNLNYAAEGVLEGFVKYKVRSMTVSIDGASPHVYAIYRIGGKLEDVLENVSKINAFKRQYNSPYPKLTWQFIVFGHNEHELPAAKNMAQELGMDFFPKIAWNPKYSPIRDRKFVKEQTGLPAVTREEYQKLTGTYYMRDMCYALWTSPRIYWDGQVFGCCGNKLHPFGGNVFTDGYLNAANTEKIVYARRMLLGEEPRRGDIPCSTCPLYRQIAEDEDWITADEILSGGANRTPKRASGFKRLFRLGRKSSNFGRKLISHLARKLR